MALIFDKTDRILKRGQHMVDLQLWKTEKPADYLFEYHAFLDLNYEDGWGAAYMIIRIANPNGIESTQEYFMGKTGFEGDPDDTLTTAWTNRATLNYKRYDAMLKEFFT